MRWFISWFLGAATSYFHLHSLSLVRTLRRIHLAAKKTGKFGLILENSMWQEV